jgi:hypothetical protein
MGWGRKTNTARVQDTTWTIPEIVPATVDWGRLVTLDFETYWDQTYTLSRLTTSEYIRDPRFKAQMVGIKIGHKPVKVYPAKKIAQALRSIPWATHSLLAHHAQFDGAILFHHFGVSPFKIYDTLSMARALFSNEIGAGLDEVSKFLGRRGKLEDRLESTRGVLNWSPALIARTGEYCSRDVEETFGIFCDMLPQLPAQEIDLIDHICRMFTEPVLRVDRPRVARELAREIEEKRQIMLSFAPDAKDVKLSSEQKKKLGASPTEEEIAIGRVKALIGSAKFVDLLKAEGIDPPVKVSPAYFKHRDESKKWAYAFSKTDVPFVELQEHDNPRVRALVEARLSVKSTNNVSRAARFLALSENGQKLPVYLKYAAAHTTRLGGGDKTNMQNLKRGGELRQSLMSEEGDVLVIVDSGQIEARTNAWLWGQEDLLEDFRLADQGLDRDAYCKFGDVVYGRKITTADKTERFVGKTCILGLGYQMGAERLRKTLALGTNGPKVFITEEESVRIVQKYRLKNHRIKAGWAVCQRIVEDMAVGRSGSYKCIAWDKETLYLPNGMKMHYPDLHDKRIADAVAAKLTGVPLDELDYDPNWPQFVYDTKETETKLYGGKMCENIVQALARIVVMEQCLAIMRTGKFKRWVMSTHDEGVFTAKKAFGEKGYRLAHAHFSTPPTWAPDLPLNADGGFDVFYSK